MAKDCSISGKKCYTSEYKAQYFAQVIREKHGHVQRPYQCEYCGKWHLTSQTDEPNSLDDLSLLLGFTFDGVGVYRNGEFIPVKHLVYLLSQNIRSNKLLKSENSKLKSSFDKRIGIVKDDIIKSVVEAVNSTQTTKHTNQ